MTVVVSGAGGACSVRCLGWNELPVQVRGAVRDRCGEVLDVYPVGGGRSCDVAVVLVLPFGKRVFCKGARIARQTVYTVRLEARVGPVLPASVPRLLWQVERAGWLLLGFEHVEGRHADLSPGSRDILPVLDALIECGRAVTPSPVTAVPGLGEVVGRVEPWRTMRDRPPTGLDGWTRRNLAAFAALEPAALELMSGRTLAHTDIHEHNLLIDQHAHRAHVVDWASARLAAAWVDLGCLVIRMIAAGHTPAQAEEWVSRATVWRDAPATAVTAFAVETYGMWEHLRHTDPQPVREAPTRAARVWARYRTGGSSGAHLSSARG